MLIDSANVIRLDPDVKRHVRARIARLPAVVHAFHEAGQKVLAELFIEYFDEADDAMFDVADKAQSNQEQNMYFDSMRELRVQRKGMEGRFFATIEEAFARLVGHDSRDVLTDGGELSAEALSLVQNEDFEQLVALEDTVDKANRQLYSQLYGINQVLSSMVSVELTINKNPFGPSVICHAIMSQFKRLDIDVKAKLLLFKLFDELVVQKLPVLFQQLQSVLTIHGVSVNYASIEESAPVSETEANSDSPQSINDESVTTSKELLELLSFVQTLPSSASSSQSTDIERVLSSVQKRRGKTLVLGCIESETIHLVQMLFQFILDNDSLDEQMKELFCRMQVPVVKVALLDEDFLTRQRHPARLLINELASVALQCSGDSNITPNDPMYVLVKRTIDRIVNHFENNTDIFKEALADFSAFVEKETRRAAILEKRTIDAEAGKAKSEQARATVMQAIDQQMMDYALPDIVVSLIRGPWSNVLFVTGLKYGFSSVEWDAQVKVLTDLIWSVQPCSDKHARQRLIVLIPGLIANLRLGFDSISYNPFEVSELFKRLEEIHLVRMRGELLAGEKTSDVKMTANIEKTESTELISDHTHFDAENVLGEIESLMNESDVPDIVVQEAMYGEELNQSADGISESGETLDQLPNDDHHMSIVAAFAQGAWFGFQAEALEDEDFDGHPKDIVRCRLAAIIKQADKYIFVNRSGKKVTEKNQQELALALKMGYLKPLDSSMLFDKALENVVTGLRKSAASSMLGLHDKDNR